MNSMTDKLLKDERKKRQTKMNQIFWRIGGILLCIGAACILLKGMSGSFVDAQGILHENFFLLPIGFFFIFSGFIVFIVLGTKNIIKRIKHTL